MLRICSALVLLALSVPAVAGVDGAVRVIDGDTLDVGGIRVRLHGIDAPEIGQTCKTADGESWDCGTWVSREVRARYQGRKASCDPVDRDRYGRVVAVCHVSGVDLGQALVRDGMAVAFRKYSKAYVDDEARAKQARLGLHAGTFQRPATHRQNRAVQVGASETACRIKGNINRSGVRIFHMPGQLYYAKTRIRVQNGERWFCSESEARAAGWRKAKR